MPTIVFKIDPKNPDLEKLNTAVEFLREGKIIAIPTETVYGLAADANNSAAVSRLCRIKNRPPDKPFSLAIANKSWLENYVYNIPPLAYKLMSQFWPGPLTLILLDKQNKTIGLRMPKDKIALYVIENLGSPLVLPSANISGKAPFIDGESILEDFSGKIDLIIDTGKPEFSKESTIVDLTKNTPQIIREGAIEASVIKEVFKKKIVLFVCTGNTCRSAMAKGLLDKEIEARKDIKINTAGIHSIENFPASEETLQLLKEEGIDLSDHRSKRLTADMVKEADLIFTMTQNHKNELLLAYPFLKTRLYLLKEFAKITTGPLDIGDPIGRGLDVYRRVFLEIKEAVKSIVKLI